MLPQIKLKPSRLPVWMQYALMLLAGAGSFYGALQLGPQPTPEGSEVELRKTSASVPIATAALPVLPPPIASLPTTPVAPRRMDAGILQNPFGALNLLVTVESLSQPVPVAVAEVKVTRPPKKVKVPSPPVIVQAPVVPPEPVEPPLPYRLLGSIQGSRIGDGAPVVFLSNGSNTLAVRAGDEIDNTYRVERIDADKVEFMYLPQKKLQWLPIVR